MNSSDVRQGRCKWFDASRGYGFIQEDGDESGVDYFAHYSEILYEGKYRTLDEGEPVSFSVKETPKGMAAINITPTGRAAEE